MTGGIWLNWLPLFLPLILVGFLWFLRLRPKMWRSWVDLPAESKVLLAVVAFFTPVLVFLWLYFPSGGWLAIFTVLSAILTAVAGQRYVAWRYGQALQQFARQSGLTFVTSPDFPQYRAYESDLCWLFNADVRRWRFEGYYPCALGTKGEFFLVVRVPLGVNFDYHSPETTRFSVLGRWAVDGFAVYDRKHLGHLSKETRKAVIAVDEGAFDAQFAVVTRNREEALHILTPEVRGRLMSLPGAGYAGIEVKNYGVFCHQRGKVVSAERMSQVMDVLLVVAETVARIYPRANKAWADQTPKERAWESSG